MMNNGILSEKDLKNIIYINYFQYYQEIIKKLFGLFTRIARDKFEYYYFVITCVLQELYTYRNKIGYKYLCNNINTSNELLSQQILKYKKYTTFGSEGYRTKASNMSRNCRKCWKPTHDRAFAELI